ncbi:MAG: DUF547 domain-containing protein [Acidobacteria bacterium]|nr:DUF547 domain-containing protein [Acidobacteriota bacterium]
MTRMLLAVVLACAVASGLRAQDAPAPAVDPLHRPFDAILDIYVRDGLVYYNALKLERARFDRYVASLGSVDVSAWPRERQLAFWINAYNAFVLNTVIDRYPIQGRAASYPPGSIRQISGAFERRTFRAAGRALTLDQIEKDLIAPLGDARAVLALGRGALGGGRLHSEAYTAERLDAQLDQAAREVVDRRELVHVDIPNAVVSVSPIFSWREPMFIEQYADKAAPVFASRSPLERAVMALVSPLAVRSEADFLEQNNFRMAFHDFDWRLNDLTNRR